ncbi:hypothetical protein BDV40DRAFT_289905 [Aspergillus tamarii]|uniref:NADP-dependent oxidoreductase domain-containing protein n=1 Tax=Aspergillus tamarii TaxID=41984 RepID=A0A5N6UPZ2_ASPTM|nr:hypothetical protein BDV40DRAFT_289905 [Aspergillus tamarii]
MTISDPFPATGFRLLGMTWRPDITPDDQAYTAMKAAITNIAAIWSSTSVYGMVPESPIAGLWLPRHYFEKDPEDAPKEKLGPLNELVRKGQRVCPEVGAATMRRAHAVCPFSVVADEYSLWNTIMLTNGAAKAWKELGVVFLTGQVTKREDILKGGIRPMFGQFQPAGFPNNLELVDKLEVFAKRRVVTPRAFRCLASIQAHSNTGDCGTIVSTAAQRVVENYRVVSSSAEEKEELDSILRLFDLFGERQRIYLTWLVVIPRYIITLN